MLVMQNNTGIATQYHRYQYFDEEFLLAYLLVVPNLAEGKHSIHHNLLSSLGLHSHHCWLICSDFGKMIVGGGNEVYCVFGVGSAQECR